MTTKATNTEFNQAALRLTFLFVQELGFYLRQGNVVEHGAEHILFTKKVDVAPNVDAWLAVNCDWCLDYDNTSVSFSLHGNQDGDDSESLTVEVTHVVSHLVTKDYVATVVKRLSRALLAVCKP